jgi:hypothetical protein
MSQHRLSPRRAIDDSRPLLDDSMREFLRMPIYLDRDHHPTSQTTIPRSNQSNRALPSKPSPPHPSEEGVDARRRAFELAHSRRVARETDIAQKTWDADERFRKWKKKTVGWKPDSATACRETDRQMIEHVIGTRNEYYMTLFRDNRFPSVKDSLVRVRPVPKEMHTSGAGNTQRFYWGA